MFFHLLGAVHKLCDQQTPPGMDWKCHVPQSCSVHNKNIKINCVKTAFQAILDHFLPFGGTPKKHEAAFFVPNIKRSANIHSHVMWTTPNTLCTHTHIFTHKDMTLCM